MNHKKIKVDYLARVEGEGGLVVKLRDRAVTEVKFNIFEPPRYFEAFLRGRHFTEVPDITARICGICPVAYQMSSSHAIENALGISVDGMLRELRRLLYCGEWIESHALHIYLLHAPDFLGYEDAIRMAKDHRETVERGLRLKKVGNQVVSLVGGREIHPVNVRVGGFYSTPTKQQLRALVEPLQWALEASRETVRFVAGLEFPDFERDYEFVALRHEREYPLNEGRLVSNKGLDINIKDYEQHFAEEHVQHSNALHSTLVNRGAYLVGPLARVNLNFDRLTPVAQEAAREAGLIPPCRNQFKSIIARAVEIVLACEEALRIVESYEQPETSAAVLQPRASMGYGCTEAPRGILYHRYRLNESGLVVDAKIVPPTSQNQKSIEEDLRAFVPARVHLSQDQLTWQCEQSVRNYDPCISCATHLVKLEWEGTDSPEAVV